MKVLFLSAMVLSASASFAQPNNPYNERGLDFVTTVKQIQEDYSAGKFKEINDASLSHYATSLKLKTEVTSETAAKILSAVKEHKGNVVSFIKNASVSDFMKDLMLETVLKNEGGDRDAYLQKLSRKVEEINGNGGIDPAEKEAALTLLSISYNVVENGYQSRGGDSECVISGPNGEQEVDMAWCVVIGMGVGFYTGFQMCGPWCGVAGAVIVFVSAVFS